MKSLKECQMTFEPNTSTPPTCFLLVACGLKLKTGAGIKAEKHFHFFIEQHSHTWLLHSIAEISCLSKKLLSKFGYLHLSKGHPLETCNLKVFKLCSISKPIDN